MLISRIAKPFPCFPGDAMVLTVNGYRAISSLRSGDYVISYDQTNGSRRPRLIKKALKYKPKRLCEIHLSSSDAPMRATPSHSFLTQRGWLRASQLKPGDILVCSNANNNRVISVTLLSKLEVVYNLVTEGEHTFIVDHGIVAHNYSLLRNVRVATDNLAGAIGKWLANQRLRPIERGA